MSKITYENKEQLNTNENIPAKNKCMASDLNEIKSVVNENDTNALYNTNVKTSQTNSDTDVYSCNYINKIGKSLWRGTFDSGSIEIAGLSKYTIIGVYTSESVLCIGTKFYGSGGFLEYGSSSNISFNAYRFNASGDTLTIDTNNTGATNGKQHIQVIEIYGIF